MHLPRKNTSSVGISWYDLRRIVLEYGQYRFVRVKLVMLPGNSELSHVNIHPTCQRSIIHTFIKHMHSPKSFDKKFRGCVLLVPGVTSRRKVKFPKSVRLSNNGRGFQLFVRDRRTVMPCCSAMSMTLSSFWSPFGPSFIVVVPLATSWNQVPFSGIVSTST